MLPPRYRICVAAHLLSIANITALLSTPFFVYERLGGGFAMSGAFGAAQAALYAFLCLISSRLVSRVGNGIHIACAGITVFASQFALMPWLNTPWACGIVSTLGIGAMAFVWPALHSWIGGEQNPQVRSRLMGWFNLSWSSGAALGPLIGGPLFDLDYRLPFMVLAGLSMLIILILLSLPHEHAYFERSVGHDAHRTAHDRAGEAFLLAAWCATLVANVLVGVARTVFPKRVEELVSAGELRLLFEATPAAILTTAPATKFSWIAFALAGTTALSFFVLGRTSGWRHSVRWLFGFQALAAAAFFVLGQTTSLLVMALCMAASGAALGVCFFSSVYYCLCNPEKKHGRAAINEAMVGLGGLLGSSLFGYFAGKYGFARPFLWTPAIVAAALGLQVLLLMYGRRVVARRYPPEAVPPMGLPDTPDLDTPLQTLASHLPVETLVPVPQEEK
jgi:MFS family permease